MGALLGHRGLMLSAAVSAFVPISATGGTVTEVEIGGRLYRVHTFSTSGDFVVTDLGDEGGAARALWVAGGASGGHHNIGVYELGGGAGGEAKDQNVTLTLGTFPVVIGAGGPAVTGNVNGVNGSDTTALGVSTDGGGYGGTVSTAGGGPAENGGGAGTWGVAGTNPPGGAGTRPGGDGFGGTGGSRSSGGGAGAGTAGGDGTATNGGAGGDGLQSDIDGTPTYYGAGAPGMGNTPGATGLGGVAGVAVDSAPNNGVDGLGSGGTGACGTGAGINSGKGGNGVVKFAYPLEAA